MPRSVDKSAIKKALNQGVSYQGIINLGLCGSKSTISKIVKDLGNTDHSISTVQKKSTVQKLPGTKKLLTPDEYFKIMARGIPKDIAKKLHALTAF